MDIYTRRTERENDYYVVMGQLEARLLTESGLSAARFLKTGRAKIEFKNELTGFTNNQLELLRGNYNSERKKLALQYLQQERKFLITQENLLRDKQATQYAAIEIKNDNGVLFYVLKGIGIIAGLTQIIVGASLIFTGSVTVIGAVAGAALLLHGSNAILENMHSLYNGNSDYKGFLRVGYESGAQLLGFTAAQGDLVYGGMDLALSGYGLTRNILKPDAWRLFKSINSDYIRGFRAMPPMSLLFEIGVDSLII